MVDERSIPNRYEDFGPELSESCYLSPEGISLNDEWDRKIRAKISELTEKLERGLLTEVDYRDGTVYVGIGGIALLFYAMYKKLDQQQNTEWLNKADELIKHAVRHSSGSKVSFLCGNTGYMAVAAAIYLKTGQTDKAEELIAEILDLSNSVCKSSSIPDELLFGRSGYLYSLMFIAKECGAQYVPGEAMEKVAKAIIKSGQHLASSLRSRCPLMYAWHDSYYLGAAHGLAGIFFTLMRTPNFSANESMKELVKSSIDYLITLRYPSGNYPSSIRVNGTDKLVHWCHGAPGFIHMFIQAYKIYDKQEYLDEAISCADVIWARGLLYKGYGLCHGVAGNGYAFLMLYQLTTDAKYLHRALKFAEFIFDYGKHGCRIADRPYSLFEGKRCCLAF
ncbi:lanC protein 2 [Trichuris trichiura]|uniref:LanC protein 2 n=1 Tax=Trichuris trichiura TaxID=36087 RepID=A0A077Z032_TRITR|nr:lanC protein 2 [Trichuris trichiura]